MVMLQGLGGLGVEVDVALEVAIGWGGACSLWGVWALIVPMWTLAWGGGGHYVNRDFWERGGRGRCD